MRNFHKKCDLLVLKITTFVKVLKIIIDQNFEIENHYFILIKSMSSGHRKSSPWIIMSSQVQCIARTNFNIIFYLVNHQYFDSRISHPFALFKSNTGCVYILGHCKLFRLPLSSRNVENKTPCINKATRVLEIRLNIMSAKTYYLIL